MALNYLDFANNSSTDGTISQVECKGVSSTKFISRNATTTVDGETFNTDVRFRLNGGVAKPINFTQGDSFTLKYSTSAPPPDVSDLVVIMIPNYLGTSNTGIDITSQCDIKVSGTHTKTLKVTVNYPVDTSNSYITFIVTKGTTNDTTKDKVYITGTFENCSCNYSDGEDYDNTKELKITANEGYIFEGLYEVEIKSEIGSLRYEMTKNDTNTILTLSPGSYKPGWDITLFDDYIASKPGEKIGTFVHLYNPSEDILTELSKVRFIQETGKSVDYGQFITSLYIFPLQIPSELIGDPAPIILGNYDSNVNCPTILTYHFDIDLGEITVPAKYNNVYDFLDTICTLYIPFFPPMVLDADFVIGQTLKIVLSVDLYSGNVTYNVYSSYNGGKSFESSNTSIAVQIPFIQKGFNSLVNQLSTVYKWVTDTARIEVTRNKPYFAKGSVFGKPVVEYAEIGSISGYAEFSNVDLTCSATNDEKEEIISILESGVFVNGNS